MKLFLIRHAQTNANSQGLTQGSGTDEPLSDLGVRQASMVAETLRDEPVNLVFSSPSRRARETAAALGNLKGLGTHILTEFAERNWGEWNMQPWVDTQKKLNKLTPEQRHAFSPPGGESEGQMVSRMTGTVHMIRGIQNENAAVVTHLSLLRLLVPLLLGEPIENGLAYDFPNASITILERRGEGFVLGGIRTNELV